MRVQGFFQLGAEAIRGRSRAPHEDRAEDEYVREVESRIDGRPRTTAEMLAAAHLECQKGGEPRRVTDCLDCERFINFRPLDDRRRIVVRCLWTGGDRVGALMTLADALVTVEIETSIEEADRIARRHGIRHLAVVSGDRFVGIVCRCDLVPSAACGEIVADRMTYPVWVVSPQASLVEAAAILRERRVGCLLVVQGEVLRGIVTRGDLRRAGLPEELLGGSACTACGSRRGVRPHPSRPSEEYCLDCLDELERVPQ